MTAVDIPDCPPVVGWTAAPYANPSGHTGTLYSPLDGAPVSVLLMDGTDGTVELWGANDFLTKDETLALAEFLTAVLRGAA
jgi:hypothetical protein